MGGLNLFINSHNRYWFNHHCHYNYKGEGQHSILLYDNGDFIIDPRKEVELSNLTVINTTP